MFFLLRSGFVQQPKQSDYKNAFKPKGNVLGMSGNALAAIFTILKKVIMIMELILVRRGKNLRQIGFVLNAVQKKMTSGKLIKYA